MCSWNEENKESAMKDSMFCRKTLQKMWPFYFWGIKVITVIGRSKLTMERSWRRWEAVTSLPVMMTQKLFNVDPPQEYGFDFMECSAATGENVVHSLETMARWMWRFHARRVAALAVSWSLWCVVRMLSLKTSQEVMAMKTEPQKKKQSGCC